ncbi:hypothetical protein [Streptomyces sp. NPDC088757]|uniref:hypothetical protein n=1 Tax=Streptomyces sp. NPDC088757 TaxID=3365889 RepID=UPI00381487EA
MDGDEPVWDDVSKFDDARHHAVEAWTAGTLGQVKTEPDGPTSYAGLERRDADSTAADRHPVHGKGDPNTGTDCPCTNRARLDDRKAPGTDEPGAVGGHLRNTGRHE